MDFRPPRVITPELGRRLGLPSANLLPVDTEHDAVLDDANSSSFIQSVWSKTYVVLDLETTGLSASDAITEIGAVKVRDNKIVDTFATLVNPQRDIHPKITAITGITNSMVEDAPTLSDALADFLTFANLPESILVAHNASFDCGFLSRACSQTGFEWAQPQVLDTLALSRTILPRPLVRDHRLATLAKFFAVTNPRAHRALADAYVTAEVLSGLVDRLEQAGARSFTDLDTAAQPVPYRHRKKVALAKDLPTTPGIYRFLSKENLVLYVGSATNLSARVRSYFTAAEKRQRISAMLDQVESVRVQPTTSTLEARILELQAIHSERPLFNSASRHQHDTVWLVLKDGVLTTEHAINTREALQALGPYRRVTNALKAREAILLALGKELDPLKDLNHRDIAVEDPTSVQLCLSGRGQIVPDALLNLMRHYADQSHYEIAAKVRDFFAHYVQGIERQRDTALVARARRIIWAHYQDEGGWRIHLASYGRLLKSLTTAPGTSPQWAVEELSEVPSLPAPPMHLGHATWEEVRVISKDLSQSGARLIVWDSTDPWAWPVDSDLAQLDQWQNLRPAVR